MARRRYLSTNISTDLRVKELAVQYGDFAALLYTWMIPHADDDASLPADPEELLYTVMPSRRDKSSGDVAAAIEGMRSLGLVLLNPSSTRLIFPSAAFYRYQSYVAAERRRTPQNTADQREMPPVTNDEHESPQNAEDQRVTPQNAASSSFPVSSSVSVSVSPSGAKRARAPASSLPPEQNPPQELASFDAVLRPFPDYHPTTAFYAEVTAYGAKLPLLSVAEDIADWCRRTRKPCSIARVKNWLRRQATESPQERTNGRARTIQRDSPADTSRLDAFDAFG